MKKGVTPRKTSCTLMSSRTPATTKQLRPIGGVIRQSSAILTTRMPNQIAHIGPDMPKAASAAETPMPPLSAITAGKTTGRVRSSMPIASMNMPRIA